MVLHENYVATGLINLLLTLEVDDEKILFDGDNGNFTVRLACPARAHDLVVQKG